ncbi:putative transmembrane protein [Apostichopus japonicus]|uniref:Putative transmembrane protein n=1 Tax=Stichopus japonicus TaxID=307972 RepID=A0A2G8JRA0_STIJA|nr:putative transmembrane protein [Apostichopus japonicus]
MIQRWTSQVQLKITIKTLYSLPAVICFMFFLRITKPDNFLLVKFAQLHIVVCLMVGAYTCIKLTKAMGSSEGKRLQLHEHEEARELGGLCFVICWLVINLKFLRSNLWQQRKLSFLQLFVALFPIFLWVTAHRSKTYQSKIPPHCKTAFQGSSGTMECMSE